MLRRHFRDADPATPEGQAKIFENGLWGTPLIGTVRLRRILYRRLRYPVFEGDDELSKDKSADATELLYTGGFYLRDVYHTLGGALEAVERSAGLLALGADPSASKLVLVRLAFSEKARRALVEGGADAAKSQRATHADQLTNHAYTDAIEARRASGRLSKLAAERLRQAFELDAQVAHDHGPLPSPGGILVTLLADIQRERDSSHGKAGYLDQAKVITDLRSSDGVSAEDVGTHSLLSKDADDKEPFRDEAVALAKHASAGVATVLARRLVHPPPYPLNIGLYWLPVLSFFMRFPKHPSRHWEEELLKKLHTQGSSFQQPGVDALADKPIVPLLGPPHFPDVREAPRREARAELEEYYRTFE